MFLLVREGLVVPWKHAKEAVGPLRRGCSQQQGGKVGEKPAAIDI